MTTITRKGVTVPTPGGDYRVFLPVLASGQQKGASVCAAGGFFAVHTEKDRAAPQPFHLFPRGADLYGMGVA